MWVEVNTQVNYPIKTTLTRMMENRDFMLENNLDKYCVSWFTIKTAVAGIELLCPRGMSILSPVRSCVEVCALS